jgi:L-iditol 2-dehydrogenase
MLAYVYSSTHQKADLMEVSTPELSEGGAVVKVLACSICGTDLRTYRYGSKKLEDGVVLGHELVGQIIQLDENVKDFHVGDVVSIAPAIGCGECRSCQKGLTNMCDQLKTIGFQFDGAFAEYMAVPKQAFQMGNVYRLPESEDYSIYTLSEPLACIINAQSFLKITKGDTVVIFGSGIIGCMHAELALGSGADRVFLIDHNANRIQELRRILAGVEFLNPKETDIFGEISRKTEGNGVDVAIIACSSGQAQEDGMNLLGKHGRISLFGGLPGESNGFIDSNLVHYKEISVFGAHASTPEQNKQAMEMIRDGVIHARNYTSFQYPLREIDQAFQDVDARKIIKATIVNDTI